MEAKNCQELITTISVIMVSGGQPNNNAGINVELFHTNGTRHCSLPNLPAVRSHHTPSGQVTCGGVKIWPVATTPCFTFSSGSWEESHNLAQPRYLHSVWSSPKGVMLLGGRDTRTTTEILTENGGTTPGFTLDYDTG